MSYNLKFYVVFVSMYSLVPITSPASTYYVCNSASACGSGWATGSDSSSAAQATSKSKPWKTIDHAENQTKPGDVVIVGSGIYNTKSKESATAVLYVKKSGLSGKPVTIKSEKKWGAIIEAKGIHSGIFFQCNSPAASYYRIDGFEIRNPINYGVFSKDSNSPYTTQCNNIEATNLKVHRFGHSGIMLEAAKQSKISNNLIHTTTKVLPAHNQYHGIYISDFTDKVLTQNNVIYNIKDGWPIHIYDAHGRGGPAKNHTVINNTLINDNPYRSGGIIMRGSAHLIRNNIIYNRASIVSNSGAIVDKENTSYKGTIIQNNQTNMKTLCKSGCRNASISGNKLGVNLTSYGKGR